MKVSIVMPAFNCSKLISLSIESVQSQSYENWELIIVDDGSSDNLKAVVEKYLKDSRVKYFFQLNGGVASARNTGISKATGDYIAFLDSDDLWPEDKLSKYIEVFNSCTDPNIGLIYSRYYCFHDDPSTFVKAVEYPRFCKSDYWSLIVLNYIATLTVMVKREVFLNIGNFDESLFGTEDWDLWIRINGEYSTFQIEEPLGYYRIHESGISRNKDRHIDQERSVVEKHLSFEYQRKYFKVAMFSLDIKELIYNLKVNGLFFGVLNFIRKKRYLNFSFTGLLYITRIFFIQLLWKKY
ncbi:glycosyltransferase family 2 protein [Halobacteriovorax marinus]|uniref:glycosyltransferase family 2 protein n=1 Tax=Halobacteriovorax marinus TaxID=97084 RepID=UPI003A8D0095